MLPDGVRRVSAPAQPPPEHLVEHQVERGETLTEISGRYRTSVRTLQRANRQISDPNKIQEGQVLQVPIGEGYGTEPVDVQVRPGDTLSQLAMRYRQPLPVIVSANRHSVADPAHIEVGQHLWIPGPAEVTPTSEPQPPTAKQPLTPLEQKAQDTDAAAQQVVTAQTAYDEVAASTNGSGAALPYLSRGLSDAKANLQQAVQAEIEERVKNSVPPGHSATEADYARASDAITQRHQPNAQTERAVAKAVEQATITRQTRAIVQALPGAGTTDPKAALKQLATAYAAASPEVRQALLADPQVQALIDAGAGWATQPLSLDPKDQLSPYAPAYQAALRLDELTTGMEPELAARVLAAAAPRIESYSADFERDFGGSPFAMEGVMHLVTALGRGAGTPVGNAVIERIAALGIWDRSGVVNAIAEGANPAYAIAFAKQPGVDSKFVMDDVLTGLSLFRTKVGDDAVAYGKHMAELGWLVKNLGGTMTQKQLDRAIADYEAEKGPEWRAEAERLKQQLADDGVKLLAQMQTMRNLPPELSDERAAVDKALVDTLNDPKAHLAISTALQLRPQLTTGEQGRALLGWFTTAGFASNAKLTDQARKLSIELATAYVKSNVLSRVSGFDPENPASVQRVVNALEELRNTGLARALGVSDDALDKAVTALKGTVVSGSESAEEIAERLKTLDKTLAGIKGFDKGTFAGQLLRGVGLGLSGVGLLASIERAGLDPSLRNDLRVLVDSAGLGQKGLELLTGLGAVDEGSVLGKLGGSAASKFLGVVSAALDVWGSAEAFSKGDVPSGILYGVGAGGGLLATFGAGSAAGPIGIGLVVVSVVGLSIWNGVKTANMHEPGSDHGVSMRFLMHAGFSESAARALVDQSGDGNSPVPLLMRYAELRGLDLTDAVDRQTFVDWINAMPPERLAALRDNLHHTIDHFDGDASRLTATADDDDFVIYDMKDRPVFVVVGAAEPDSAAQIDAVLGVLELPVPHG